MASIHHERHKAQKLRERSLILLLLFAVMVTVVFAGITLAFYLYPEAYKLLARRSEINSTITMVETQIADRRISIAEQFVARIDRKFLGSAKRIDLKFPWPIDPNADLSGPAVNAESGNWFLVTFEPREGRQTLERFYETVYKVYLTDHISSEEGMTVRRFKHDGPYSDSVIYVDERTAEPTIIRCDLRASSLGPILCERHIIVSDGVLARLRFAKTELAHWLALEKTAKDLINKVVSPAP